MTSNVNVSPLSAAMSLDSRTNSGKCGIELPSVLSLPLVYNNNSNNNNGSSGSSNTILRRRTPSMVSSDSSSVSSSKRCMPPARHSLPFKKRKFVWIAIEPDDDDDRNETKECLSPVVGVFSPGGGAAAPTATTATTPCPDAASSSTGGDSTRSLCGSDTAPDDPQPQKPWIATTPGLGILVPVVSSRVGGNNGDNGDNGSSGNQPHEPQAPQHPQGSAVACITPLPRRISRASSECRPADGDEPEPVLTTTRVPRGDGGSGGGGSAAPPPPSSSRPKRAPRDRLYRGSGSSHPAEVRCLAISTRGKRCCYAAVDSNGNRYCHRHSSFFDGETATTPSNTKKTTKTTKTKKKEDKTDNETTPNDDGAAAKRGAPTKTRPGRRGDAAAAAGEPAHGAPRASGKRSRQRSADPAAAERETGPRLPTALSDLSTDLWRDRRVRVSKGPHAGKTGTVSRWRNGWVTVELVEATTTATTTTCHNRRSYELFLV